MCIYDSKVICHFRGKYRVNFLPIPDLLKISNPFRFFVFILCEKYGKVRVTEHIFSNYECSLRTIKLINDKF